MNFGPVFWALVALGVVAAAAYGFYFLRRPASWLRAGVKTLAIGAPAAGFIVAGAPFPLVLALAASALGDFFLAFNKKWVLPLGILAFLIAQLVYFVIFGAIWFFSGDNSPLWPRYAAMGVLIATTLSFVVWLWKDDLKRVPVSGSLAILMLFATGFLLPLFIAFAFLPDTFIRLINDLAALVSGGLDPDISSPSAPLILPIMILLLAAILGGMRRELGAIQLAAMIYAGAITLMAVMAMWLPWNAWPAMLGAVLFVVSDLVLAMELFRLPENAPVRVLTAKVVWWTYVAAQALIVTGILLAAM
jgi:uncharacterized membrane protein YhhN